MRSRDRGRRLSTAVAEGSPSSARYQQCESDGGCVPFGPTLELAAGRAQQLMKNAEEQESWWPLTDEQPPITLAAYEKHS